MSESLGIIQGGKTPGLEHGESPNPLMREHWYFTFGIEHPLAKRFVRLYGTGEDTRMTIVAIFGGNWCGPYDRYKGAEIVGKYRLTELDLGL